MKKITIIAGLLFGTAFLTSCTKDDCVCTSTTTENGVVTNTSTQSSGSSGIGPAGAAGDASLCNSGDYSSSYTSGGVTYTDVTECELE